MKKTNNSKQRATICLNMIVKDESHIIKGTLEMLCNKINFDYWVICDTGSTDDTPKIITDFFKQKKIKGELHNEKWVNFAHNRTSALEKAYKKTDLLLVFDADDELHGNFNVPQEVSFDEYHMKFGSAHGMSYTRVLLINNKKRFKYFSVIHEFISCQEPNSTSAVIDGDYYVVSGRSGSRNKDPDKYLKDALVLASAHAEALITKDPLYLRYAYYCANSYRDCGRFEDAIKWYKITLSQDNWAQEKYMASLSIYECYNSLNQKETGFFYLVKAFTYDLERVECLYPLLVHYCCDNMNKVAYGYYLNVKEFFETKYLTTPMTSKLFINQDKANFFVPYYMVLIADKVQDFPCVVKMYEIVFTKKQPMFEPWYVKNFLYNLQFFVSHAKDKNFIKMANEYIRFLKSNGVPLYSFDFLKDYGKFGIEINDIFNIEVKRDPTKFSKDQCKACKNIMFYTGFSDIEWNYSYMSSNALGGSEKAVAYLSKNFPSDYHIYVTGAVKNETVDNISYVNLRDMPELLKNTPFHTIICSRYIAFLDMFKDVSFYQYYIWAHDTHLINYGCNLQDVEIVIKWSKYIDGCICQTKWHADEYISKYPQLKDKIHTINNGINTSVFSSTNVKQPNKFIYSSRTERGLVIVLALWPQILKKLPDAQLVISTYTKFPGNPEEVRVKSIIDQYPDSIKHLGQLNAEQLYKEMSSAEYWLYPSIYPETSCITALEMLMSEVICLYYPLAGLPYTMKEYGIQMNRGNEIEKLCSLTTEQKTEMRINGRKYAESCSWENRGQEWSKLLKLTYNATKHVAIYNGFEFHYEIFGYIINYCYDNKYKLTIFTNDSGVLGWFNFYNNKYNNFIKYDKFTEFEKHKDKFDLIFLTTDDDWRFNNDWINDKCISIRHHADLRRPQFVNNLDVRPFIRNQKNYALPCFPIFQINDKPNIKNGIINIAIIGGKHEYKYNIINRLKSENNQIILHIISRTVNIKKDLIRNDIISTIYQNIDTVELLNILKTTDYILTDVICNEDHTYGNSMSGCIPLSFSTLTPLIINKNNNSMYKFKNAIEFDPDSNDDIIVEKTSIDIQPLLEERTALMSSFTNYVNGIVTKISTKDDDKWWIYGENYFPEVLEEYKAGLKTKHNVEITDDFNLIINSKPTHVSFIYCINDQLYGLLLKLYPKCIVSLFNLEPLNLTQRKMNVIANYNKYNNLKIYDYSLSNIRILVEKNITNVEHMPYIVTQTETNKLRILNESTEKIYDFGILTGSGAPNNSIAELGPKRRAVVEYLLSKGFTVNIIKEWKDKRDIELAKCHIILNIHGQMNPSPGVWEDSRIFEHVRCDRLIAGGLRILSETCDYLDYKNYDVNKIKFIDFEQFKHIENVSNVIDISGSSSSASVSASQITKVWESIKCSSKTDITPAKNYCFIHSCNLSNVGIYRLTYLIDKLNISKCIDIFEKIFINNIGLPIENTYGDKFVVTNYSDNCHLYEAPTVNKMKHFSLENGNENANILYIHTKGVRYSKDDQKENDWIDLMMYFLVEKYQTCLDRLAQNFDAVGCNYYCVPSRNIPPHFSGNFWWARSSYLKNVADVDESLQDRNTSEYWLFRNNPVYHNLYSSNIDHYMQAYPRHLYEKE